MEGPTTGHTPQQGGGIGATSTGASDTAKPPHSEKGVLKGQTERRSGVLDATATLTPYRMET